MLNWADQFSILLFLDSNGYRQQHGVYECLLAAGAHDAVAEGPDMLAGVEQLHRRYGWVFGHICYDHKNALHNRLSTSHKPALHWPQLGFFAPEVVCHIDAAHTTLTIESFSDPDAVYADMMAQPGQIGGSVPKLSFTARTSREQYLDTVEALRRHIADGDCYEINYCTEGYFEGASIEPLTVFHALNRLSPAPFAAYYRHQDKYMMCASPERYLARRGDRVLSQPIKGTARRDSDPAADEQIKERLATDTKERAENVMIVDLVRNDLARSCATGTVQVDELFGIYSFPQVHQMISTVSGRLRPDMAATDAIRYSFPMGSMTGAPKHKVMQLIDRYEHAARELFSGTVGYISPSGDMDLNVIIRSLFYDAATSYLCYQTGGAITYDSLPTAEWDEMRLKAWAIERIFS
jgi:para-aminobenzoate synthetase component I